MQGWRIGTEWRVALVASAIAFAAILLDVTPLLRGPAPYPPEWQWDLRTTATSGWPLVVLIAAALAALAAFPPRFSLGLALAVTLGWSLQLSIAGLEPAGMARTLMERTLSRTSTSYLTVAASDEARDPAAFLDHHAELLPELQKGAKHAATHPPGPVLFYRGLIGVFARAPMLADALLMVGGIDPDAGRRPPSVRASALAGPLLITLLCAAAAWPLARLARLGGMDGAGAVRLAALWPLLPGPALMTPQFDQLLALPVTACAALLASALVGPRAVVKAVAAGLCAGIALQLSYGAAAFVAIAALAVLALLPRRDDSRRYASVLGWAAAGGAFVVLLPMAWGHDPPAAARTALAIHREVFTAPRSYATWLVFNPLDLALFAGVPVAAVGIARCAQRVGDPFDRVRVAVATGLALLLVSGTLRGEIGRIAIPLMPMLLLAALGRTAETGGFPRDEAIVAAILLAASTLVIAARWSVA